MPEITTDRTWTVAEAGRGKEDYSRDVASSRDRPGLSLKYNQETVLFSYVPTDLVSHPYAIPWVQPVLGAGETAHAIDMATGIAMPYTIAAGYTLTLIELIWNFNQQCEIWAYMDDLLIASLGVTGQALPQLFNPILGYSSASVDPDATVSHTMDLIVINRGLSDMRGEVGASAILEAVGTPPFPSTKTVKCPFCEAENVVPVSQTTIKCSACGDTYYVWAANRIRRTP